MNTYTVDFFYNTDCRTSWTGEAYDEVRALAIAMTCRGIEKWVEAGIPFTIRIS